MGSTVTDGCLHAEQVTVDVKAPANVWSVRQLGAEEGCGETYGLYSCSSTFDLWQLRESDLVRLERRNAHLNISWV
jgi:hypothetical protein